MAGTAGPNLGLVRGYSAHESGWGVDGYNPGFDLLDAVTFLSVISASIATPPGSPTAGDRYVVAASATGAWSGHEKDLAIYREGAWAFYTPKLSWKAFNQATNAYIRFDGTNWISDLRIVTLTASSSATLDFTGLSGESWRLVGRLLVPATSTAVPWIRFGTSSGPTWSTSGFRYAGRGLGTGGFDPGALNGESQGQLAMNGTHNVTPGASFDFIVNTDNANWAELQGTFKIRSTDGHDYCYSYHGLWATSVALTGIRFLYSTGNVASGNISIYPLSV